MIQIEEFQTMVSKLETKSALAPFRYKFNVGLLAGLGLLALVTLTTVATIGILSLISVPFLLWRGGFHQGILLAHLLKAMIFLAIPLWIVVKVVLGALLVRFPIPQGVEVTKEQAPELHKAIDNIRMQLHGPKFHYVLINAELNAAVVQRPLFGVIGPVKNYLVIGLPLMDSMTVTDTLAVIAHEYGHLAGSHGKFGAYIYRLRLTWSTLHALSNYWKGPAAAALRRMVDWYVPYFNAYTFVLARSHEYQADAASAQLVGKSATAQALMRVEINARNFHLYQEETHSKVLDLPEPPSDFQLVWSTRARSPAESDTQKWFRQSMRVEPTVSDTHPSLVQRLEAILGEDAVSAMAPPAYHFDVAASDAWLGQSASRIRDQVQALWASQISDQWGANHESNLVKKKRLQELIELPNLTQSERADRLLLQLALDPAQLSEAELLSYGVTFPESGIGYFVLGAWQLKDGNEAGLSHLEKACEVNAELTKPACEKAYTYLSSHEDPRAGGYKTRWQARDALEKDIAMESSDMSFEHALQSPDLSEADMERVVGLTRANSAALTRAFFVRRILPADPSVKTYVLAFELKSGVQRDKNPDQIIQDFVKTPGWPVHIVFVALVWEKGVYKPLFYAVPDAEITLDAAVDDLVAEESSVTIVLS